MHLGSYINRKVFGVLHYAAADRVSKISPKKVIFLTIWVRLICSIQITLLFFVFNKICSEAILYSTDIGMSGDV